jgi:hypothetical protein
MIHKFKINEIQNTVNIISNLDKKKTKYVKKSEILVLNEMIE